MLVLISPPNASQMTVVQSMLYCSCSAVLSALFPTTPSSMLHTKFEFAYPSSSRVYVGTLFGPVASQQLSMHTDVSTYASLVAVENVHVTCNQNTVATGFQWRIER